MLYEAITIGVNRVRIPRLLSRLFKVGYVVLGFGAALLYLVDFGPAIVGMISLGSWGVLIASYVLSLVESLKTGRVETTETALVLHRNGKAPRAIPRRDIVGALVVRRILQNVLTPTVEVSVRGGDRINIKLADFETAEALVRDLGFAADGARLHVDLAQPSRRLLHLPIAFVLYMMTTILSVSLSVLDAARWLSFATGPLVLLGLYALLVRRFSASTLVIGRDGVLVRKGYKKKLYRADDPTLVGVLRGVGVDEGRMAEALHAAHQRAAGAKPVATMFERGGLSLPEWRGRIAAAMDGGYRTSGNVPDLARAVLASSDSAPDERIGAALALRVAGDVDVVRSAGAATASDDLRLALDAVADEADDRVVEKRLRRAL